MPTGSGRSETKDPNPADETSSDDTNANLLIEIDCDRPSYRIHDPSLGRLSDRIRIVTLEAEIALLERERATLNEQIAVLESEVEALEAEIATLEAATAGQAPDLQRVIDRYERIITKKDREYRERVEMDESTHSSSGRSIVSTLKQLLGHVTTRRNQGRNDDG